MTLFFGHVFRYRIAKLAACICK